MDLESRVNFGREVGGGGGATYTQQQFQGSYILILKQNYSLPYSQLTKQIDNQHFTSYPFRGDMEIKSMDNYYAWIIVIIY